ncbi:MAG: hypothetical protein AAFQ96_00335 [Pseudomonadota bacterium]
MMTKLSMLLAAFLVSAACAEPDVSAPSDTTDTNAAADAAPATFESAFDAQGESAFGAEGVGEARPIHERARETFAPIELDKMRPAFTRATVMKLNAIVQRALDATNEYDRSVRTIRADVSRALADDAGPEDTRAASDGVAKLADWRARTKAAFDDMGAASAALKASDEVYNENLLAGMELFVEKVEKEIREEHEKLSAKLAAG